MKNVLLFILLLLSVTLNAQNDCTDALVVCGNTNFNDIDVTGPGALQEVNSCGGHEHNSIWMKIKIATSGTLEFTIIPQSSSLSEDFDFYLYYFDSCIQNNIIRCSTTNPVMAGLSYNITGLRSSETDTSEGPATDGNGFVSVVDVVEGETYMLVIDRAIGNSNFSLIWSGTATFNEPPKFDLPPEVTSLDLTECDVDGVPNASTAFNLTQNTPLIIGSQTDVEVTYYINESDAFLGVNPIANPNSFVNTSNPQTIYVRIENTITECYNNGSFTISISGEIGLSANEFSICDDTTDGSQFNGQTTFNMQEVTSIVYPDFGPGITLNYYLSKADAENDINPLPQFFYNTVPELQTIFIKIDDGNCFLISPIDLIVHSFPAVAGANLVQCDYGINPDGLTTFNLKEADGFFTNGDPSVSVTYYLDNASLAADLPLSANYTNVANPQVIIAKLINGNGCSAFYPLTLIVNVTAGQTIAALETCDLQQTGFATFNLSQANVVLSPSQTAAYYATLQNALLKQNQLTNLMYTNTSPYNSSVFVRVEDGMNGCSGISEIPLKVNRLPQIEANDEAYICANISGFQTTIDAGILDGQPYNFVWSYGGSVLPYTTYAINVDQPGTYKVDIINSHGCINTRSVEVSPSYGASITSVISQGTAVENNSVIINPALPNYSYSIDHPEGPFQSSNQFYDISCGIHTAYVIDNDGCGVGSKSFEIIGIPVYFTPNDDGHNDTWNLRCTTTQPDTIIQIFDRFGKFIKQIKAGGEGWDGNFNGKKLPSDDYWYFIKFSDGRTQKGHFALKR
ncbi:T9SS type B sorting domain-containing protein [Flavobacterium silvisoli]|uniref:T9SS type B sorting domain-containing protein n=1 Tax=Flavobacterium silvisoli TaxID=2529433 RepID=A0A4V2L5K3_9FLAO|nr:T9SS type B sorting domain-containing protein [Flavobacterium silvisoli]TBX71001.1 T9SS type B sorting domain-containing protein [Flavobacterium silvisoli]